MKKSMKILIIILGIIGIVVINYAISSKGGTDVSVSPTPFVDFKVEYNTK